MSGGKEGKKLRTASMSDTTEKYERNTSARTEVEVGRERER